MAAIRDTYIVHKKSKVLPFWVLEKNKSQDESPSKIKILMDEVFQSDNLKSSKN